MKFREIPLINKPATEEVISITRSGIGFSSKFIVNQKLESMESVSFGTVESRAVYCTCIYNIHKVSLARARENS